LAGWHLWAFGGMALVDTPLQRRMKLKDSPEIALADWLRFGELGEADVLPRQWASLLRGALPRTGIRLGAWRSGLKFMPAVNWVERGMLGDGNSLPRYHIVWGTSRQLTRCMIEVMHAG
jgi:predicted oxidoreductase